MPNPGFAWKKMCFLPCLKAKIKEKQKNNFLNQKPFAHFWKKNLISNFIFGDCFLRYLEGFCTKNFFLKIPVIFWKWR